MVLSWKKQKDQKPISNQLGKGDDLKLNSPCQFANGKAPSLPSMSIQAALIHIVKVIPKYLSLY